MYIVPLAWLYVVLMMCAAEAGNPQGTLLGALVTLVLYGLLPIGLLLYFMRTPARRRALRAQEEAEDLARAQAAAASAQPDAGRLSPTHTVAPVREET